ncbi:MAG: hypothetical protein ACOYON_13125 [Fimbriimonas sp.]
MILDSIRISPSVQLSLQYSGEEFLGVGAVTIDGQSMRSDARPAFVEIRTPDAVKFLNFRLASVEVEGETQILTFAMDKVDDGFMEYMLHTVRSRYRAGDWSLRPQPAVGCELRMEIRPVEREFGDAKFRGYAYRYVWRSADHPIYRILDRSTWEPGGSALDREFWLRNGTSPSIWPVDSHEQHLSTEWFLPPIAQPNIFQFLPFQAQLCGFTLTHSSEGALMTWATEVAHIRSLFEKPRNSEVLVHLHEHCGDLSSEFRTSWVEVLWKSGGVVSLVDKFNLWESARSHVWSDLNSQVGFVQEKVAPYGVMEEWSLPEFDAYTDLGVPKLLEAGCQTFMIPSEQENNMNTWGSSNMCCVVDWKIAETVGEGKLARFCSAIRAGGGWVEMWGNTALSALQYNLDILPRQGHSAKSDRIQLLPREGTVWEVLDQAPRPWVHNPAGHIEADHYTPVFCQTNLGDPLVRAHWLACWQDHKDRIGIDGMFLDSSFNMSADKFSWVQNSDFDQAGGATIDQTDLLRRGRPAVEPRASIQSQYLPYLETLAEMQRFGFHLSVEDTGVFGVSRSGPGVLDREPTMPMWVDALCVFDLEAIQEAGLDAEDVFFRGLAYRNMWYLYWSPQHDTLSWRQDRPTDPLHQPTADQLDLYRAYGRALPYFGVRTIHPNESVIEYATEEARLFWSREAVELDLGRECEIQNLVNGFVEPGDRLRTKPFAVYLVK